MQETVLAEDEEGAGAQRVCYSCQSPLEGDAKVCLICGHRQYRVCYCGEQIPPDLATCYRCGTDWSQSSRVKEKRKSRTHGSLRGLARSAVSGAIIFGAICELLYLAGGRAAQEMGMEAPTNVVVRLSYLAMAIGSAAQFVTHRLLTLASNGHMLQLLGLLITGAAMGALWYLLHHSRWIRIKLGLLKSRRHRRAA